MTSLTMPNSISIGPAITPTESLKTANASTFADTIRIRFTDLTGWTDTPTLSFSCWCRLDVAAGSIQVITKTNGNRFQIQRHSTDVIQLVGRNSAGTVIQNINAGSENLTQGVWRHLLISVDATNGFQNFYIDDSDVLTSATNSAGSIDVDQGAALGVASDGLGGGEYEGCISEFWLSSEYIDFSLESQRRLFISSTGKPVQLGSDGSTPTGTPPEFYLPNAAATVNENEGSGADGTLDGTPTACSNVPSD